MRRIILDCDPGHDDAVAILFAAASRSIKLEAVTTVAGNQTVEKTAYNALKVCSLASIQGIPIAAGMDRPLVREHGWAASIHGESGLDGPNLPEPTLSLAPIHAVDLLIDLLLDSSGDITIVATGPLTNLASAMRREPRIVPQIEQIVLMGGAMGLGNWTPSAEFNMYIDPEAAHIVFTSGRPITMIGLDVTHQVLATPEIRSRFRSMHTAIGDLVDDLLGFFAESYLKVFGFTAPPLHDPCAVAHIIDPSVIRTQPMHVDIELAGRFTVGRTVCDIYGTTGEPPNAQVGIGIDVPRFWDLLIETLMTLDSCDRSSLL